MRIRKLLLIALALLIPAVYSAQTAHPRTRRGASPKFDSPTGTYKDLAGTFHGKLKDITGKEIVIENEQNQIVSIRRTRKTRFLKDEREIKPSEIARDTSVTVDAAEDIDLKPMALTVTVDSAQKKTDEP
ncbi:MAG: hypothetical protein ACR2NN_03420 [Bryobacteraceae bacterium]